MRGVILTTVGRKNPLHSVDALTAHAILRCEAPKNLLRNVCHSERSVSGVKNPKQKARDSSHSVNRPRFGMTDDVILTTVGRKNLLPSVEDFVGCNVILKGFALKNLRPSRYFV